MQSQQPSQDAGIPRMQRRLWQSVCLAVPLLCLSLTPPVVLSALAQLVLTLPLCALHRDLFLDAWQEVRRRSPGRDALAALAAALAAVYGVAAVILAATGQPYQQELTPAAGVMLTLTAAGRLLEARLLAEAAGPLRRLGRLTPQTACVLRDGRPVDVPAAEVQPGEMFLVRPGEVVPVDGVVCEGVSTIDESPLTGAQLPADKFPGSPVHTATRNRDGTLTCRAVRVGKATTLIRVVRLARGTAATKAPMAVRADRAAALLAPAALLAAAAALVIWLLLGRGFGFALGRFIAVLAVACPGALYLGVPAAVLAGSGTGFGCGMLFRTAEALETTGCVHTVLLDKNGTITAGAPSVVQIVGTRKVPAKFLLGMAAGLELRCSSPQARAILKKAEEEKIAYSRLTDFEELPGQGLCGRLAGKVLAGGDRTFISAHCELPPDLLEAGERLEAQGAQPLYFSLAGHAAGVIGVSEEVKTTSKPAVASMRGLGLDVRLMTGDDAATAAHLAGMAGLDEAHVISAVPADGQAAEVNRLQENGPVALVAACGGEALAAAAVGVYLGVEDIPESADLVLPGGELADVAAAVRLSRRVVQLMRQGLYGALVYNLAGILLAAGVLAPLGLVPGPMTAALAAALAGAAVMANALRLRRFDPRGGTDKTGGAT